MPINISRPHHVIGTNNKLSLKAAYFLKYLLIIPVRNSINYLQPVTKWELGFDCCVSPPLPTFCLSPPNQMSNNSLQPRLTHIKFVAAPLGTSVCVSPFSQIACSLL